MFRSVLYPRFPIAQNGGDIKQSETSLLLFFPASKNLVSKFPTILKKKNALSFIYLARTASGEIFPVGNPLPPRFVSVCLVRGEIWVVLFSPVGSFPHDFDPSLVQLYLPVLVPSFLGN